LSYKVTWHENAAVDLRKLDKAVATDIVGKVDDHLSEDPLALGKPQKGIFRGLFRYRCGDDRVIYSIDRQEERLVVLTVGHRKDVYRRPR
jgi:mRNA interferase RelE/StbE